MSLLIAIASLVRRPEPAGPAGRSDPLPVVGTASRPGLRYGADLAWDGTRLTGRLGGRWRGETVLVQWSGDGFLGTVGGRSRPIAVQGLVSDARLELHALGSPSLSSAVLSLDGDGRGAVGTAVGREGTVPLVLEFGPDSLRSRMGQGEDKGEVCLSLAGVPWSVAATAALLADRACRDLWDEMLEALNDMGER